MDNISEYNCGTLQGNNDSEVLSLTTWKMQIVQ